MVLLLLVILGVGAATTAATVAAALGRAAVVVDSPSPAVLLHPRLSQARQVAEDGLGIGRGARALLEALDVGGTALVRPVGIYTRSERVAGNRLGVEVGLDGGNHGVRWGLRVGDRGGRQFFFCGGVKKDVKRGGLPWAGRLFLCCVEG